MYYSIDKLSVFRGVIFCEGWFSGGASKSRKLALIVDGATYSPQLKTVRRGDVAAIYGAGAENWGFRFACPIDSDDPGAFTRARIRLYDGRETVTLDASATNGHASAFAEVRACEDQFFSAVHAADNPRVVELGARARSGISRRERFEPHATYVGFDIMEGPNVDVVGDAHFMSRYLPADHFDFAFSISTFEHLLMPWKAAAELNAVLKMGGMAFIHSHQSWSVHDAPWDFFRFSKFAWHGLFNKYSGFEIMASGHGDPATIVSQVQTNNLATFLENETGYLTSVCVIRKIGASTLRWDADPGEIVRTAYPT